MVELVFELRIRCGEPYGGMLLCWKMFLLVFRIYYLSYFKDAMFAG
jgi:hypothetical protein